MGEALLRGLLSSKHAPEDIAINDANTEKVKNLSQELGIRSRSLDKITTAETLIFAVKPQQIKDLISALKKISFAKKPLIISIAAGIKTSVFENAFGEIPVIRAMPNTPALVKKGVSVLSKGRFANETHLSFTENIFESLGIVLVVDEKYQDIVTAVSGSGPAYFFLFVEYLIKAAIKLGLDKDVAAKLVAGTFVGSAKLLDKTGEEPENLRKAVTSPGGTTEAAIEEFKNNDLETIVFESISAAKKRSEELSSIS